MRYFIRSLGIIAVITALLSFPAFTQADPTAPPVPVKITHSVVLHYDKQTIQQAVIDACAKYKNCDRGVALAIVEAETGHYTKFIGDNGTSIGIAQIHMPAHPEVSLAQAENIYFSANFLALNLAEGHCSMWSTCPLNES